MADELEVRARAAPRMLTLSCLVEGPLPPDLSSPSRDQPSQSPAPCAGTPRAANSRCSSFARRSSSSRVRASSSCSAEGSRRAALRCSSHSICGQDGVRGVSRRFGSGRRACEESRAHLLKEPLLVERQRPPLALRHLQHILPEHLELLRGLSRPRQVSLQPLLPAAQHGAHKLEPVTHDAELERVLRLQTDRRRRRGRRGRLVGLCRRACGPGRARGRGAAAPVVGTGVRRELLEDGVNADVRVEGAHPVRVLLRLVVGGRSEVARRRKRRCVPRRGDGSRWRGCLTARRSPR